MTCFKVKINELANESNCLRSSLHSFTKAWSEPGSKWSRIVLRPFNGINHNDLSVLQMQASVTGY